MADAPAFDGPRVLVMPRRRRAVRPTSSGLGRSRRLKLALARLHAMPVAVGASVALSGPPPRRSCVGNGSQGALVPLARGRGFPAVPLDEGPRPGVSRHACCSEHVGCLPQSTAIEFYGRGGSVLARHALPLPNDALVCPRLRVPRLPTTLDAMGRAAPPANPPPRYPKGMPFRASLIASGAAGFCSRVGAPTAPSEDAPAASDFACRGFPPRLTRWARPPARPTHRHESPWVCRYGLYRHTRGAVQGAATAPERSRRRASCVAQRPFLPPRCL